MPSSARPAEVRQFLWNMGIDAFRFVGIFGHRNIEMCERGKRRLAALVRELT